MENATLRQNPDGFFDNPIATGSINNMFVVEVMRIYSKVMHDMLFECLLRLDKHMQGKNHSIIVTFVPDEEMQIMWHKRRMLNGTPYNISGQFPTQTHKTLSIILLRYGKDELLMDDKPVVVPVAICK